MHRGKRFRSGQKKHHQGTLFKHDFIVDPWIQHIEHLIAKGACSASEWQLVAPLHPLSDYVQQSFFTNPWEPLERSYAVDSHEQSKYICNVTHEITQT